MKVIKISDQAYAQVCKVASVQQTYLADALDLIVFRKVTLEGDTDEDQAFLDELFGPEEVQATDSDDGA